jgi:Rrf2 family iron-sulfur cluster assembly transcriptional regulator
LRLTTKGRYAVTAMLDLAFHGNRGPIPLADIARRQGISLSYLEQLFARLRRQGLVTSIHGPGGGYRLGHSVSDISLVDVITAVDERVDTTRCGGEKNCQDGEACLTHELWEDLSQQIHDFLDGVSLEQVMGRADVRDVAVRQDSSLRSPVTVEVGDLNIASGG